MLTTAPLETVTTRKPAARRKPHQLFRDEHEKLYALGQYTLPADTNLEAFHEDPVGYITARGTWGYSVANPLDLPFGTLAWRFCFGPDQSTIVYVLQSDVIEALHEASAWLDSNSTLIVRLEELSQRDQDELIRDGKILGYTYTEHGLLPEEEWSCVQVPRDFVRRRAGQLGLFLPCDAYCMTCDEWYDWRNRGGTAGADVVCSECRREVTIW